MSNDSERFCLIWALSGKKRTHLIGYLSQNLITKARIGKSSLDDVVPKQILLSPI